jgi:hypothetical protein
MGKTELRQGFSSLETQQKIIKLAKKKVVDLTYFKVKLTLLTKTLKNGKVTHCPTNFNLDYPFSYGLCKQQKYNDGTK